MYVKDDKMELTSKINIKRYKSTIVEEVADTVIVEKPLNIYINNEHYVTLMCSPSLLEELTIGFLFSEGLIERIEEIDKIDYKNDESIFVMLKREVSPTFGKTRALVSGCAKGSVHISLLNEKKLKKIHHVTLFKADNILKWMNEFNSMPSLFQQTGGVHSCCLCSQEGIELIAEDIGRHNALDKLIGICLKNNLSPDSKIILTSGRLSSDILIKTANAGFPILVSHSAPTDLVVNMAKNINLTIIGFARGNRMNIYCGSNRIILNDAE
jgi:FdhD protein